MKISNFFALFAFLFIVLSANTVYSQTKKFSISSKVLSNEHQPLKLASIRLAGPGDKNYHVFSDDNGGFTFSNIPSGQYLIKISHLGFQQMELKVSLLKESLSLQAIVLQTNEYDLKTVEIKAQALSIPFVIKKDTLEYNANAFKTTQGAMLQELLKKLPGIEVSSGGGVSSQGEKISKITLNGKEYFTGDILLATMNIPVDIIDKLELIDRASDQASQLRTNKILNIKTKQDKSNGLFGKVSAAYGSSDRFALNGNINFLTKLNHFTLIQDFDNINGLSTSVSPGITRSVNTGFNFSRTTSAGTNLNLSYTRSHSNLKLDEVIKSQTVYDTLTQVNRQSQTSNDIRTQHRLNALFDTKLSPSVTFKIMPTVSITDFLSRSVSEYANSANNQTVTGTQSQINNGRDPSLSNNIYLYKKFQRAGKSIVLNVNTTFQKNKGSNQYLRNETDSNIIAQTPSLNIVNQEQLNDITRLNNYTSLVFTQPLVKSSSIAFKISNNYMHSFSERLTYDLDTLNQIGHNLNPLYSNTFKNVVYTNIIGFAYAKNTKKQNLSIGIDLQQNNQENTALEQRFLNLLPYAEFLYNFSKSEKLNIRFNTKTTLPDIAQVQPGSSNIDNSVQIIGNVELKPSYSSSLAFSYNNYNAENKNLFFLNLNLAQISNNIVPSALFDSSSNRNIISFINAKNSYNGMFTSLYSFPLADENKLNLQIGLNATFNSMDNITAGKSNLTKIWILNNNYRLNGQYEKLDFSINTSVSYNTVSYSIQKTSNQNSLIYNATAELNYNFPLNISSSLNLSFNNVSGRTDGFNQSIVPVNLNVKRQFLKNKAAMIKFSVNDLFNQNVGVSRIADGINITDRNYNVLKRYVLLTLSYSLSKFKK